MAPETPWTQTDRRLVDTVGIGRVALSSGALPVVIVVRCTTDRDRILLHSSDAALARAARDGDVVALQVDDVTTTGEGSSVLITGVLAPHAAGVVRLAPALSSHTPVHLGSSDQVSQAGPAGTTGSA